MAQYTYNYDDGNDLECERHIQYLQEQLGQFQKELQEQRQELEMLKKTTANQGLYAIMQIYTSYFN